MKSATAQLRQKQADLRRQDRETRKRQKDLERRIKEQAKLSELEQARLQVEAHENSLEMLLSIHKEQSAPIEWGRFASALPPHQPVKPRRHEFAAELKRGTASYGNVSSGGNTQAEEARVLDDREQEAVHDNYASELREWERMRALAKRVLSGESGAYSAAISEFSSLADVTGLGSSLNVTIHSPKLIGCALTVNGREIVPTEMKSLTAAGKLSVKTMPKPRFHEIYQDYVCGCVLRLAREMLALLPVDEVLVTASVNGIDVRGGKAADLPVLSVSISRTAVQKLDFERLDPSDAMESFPHRGNVTTSRKSGEFISIVPLTPADLAPTQTERLDFSGLLTNLRQLRAEISSQLKPVAPITDKGPQEASLPA